MAEPPEDQPIILRSQILSEFINLSHHWRMLDDWYLILFHFIKVSKHLLLQRFILGPPAELQSESIMTPLSFTLLGILL